MTGWSRYLSVTQRLLALIAVALVPTLAALLYLNLTLYRIQLDAVHETAFNTGELASLEMKRIVTGVEATLFAVARVPAVRSFARPECDAYLSDVVRELPQFRAIVAIDSGGRVGCSSSSVSMQEGVQDLAVLDEAKVSRGFTVGTFARPSSDAADDFLPLVLPFYEESNLVGLVVAKLDLGWLGEQVRGRDFPQGASLTVADRSGVILAREPQPERFVGTRIPAEYQALVHAEEPGSLELTSQDGTRRVIGYFPPPATGAGLYISAGLSTETALGPARAVTYRSLLLAGLGTIGAFVLAWTVGTRLFRDPIRQLVRTVEAWRHGDESARTGIASDGSELSILAHDIDRYMDELLAGRRARRAAEESRDLLLREMEHRLKNTLATVQAIIRQTLKGQVPPEIMGGLSGRLSAMSDAHQMLLSDNWQSADLQAVVETALRPFGIVGTPRLSVSGPPLRITPRATLSLTLVLHELGTNALKYGSLADPDGRVEVAWRLTSGGTSPRFNFVWTEHDGPPVAPPQRSGFGRRLIEAALSSEFDARVSLTYAATGVTFCLEADAERLLVNTAEKAA